MTEAQAGAQLARILHAMREGRRMAGIAELVDARLLEAHAGRVRVEYAVKPEFMHPGQAVQGGIVTVYADMAMALAAHTLCDEGEFLTTSQLSISFLAPVTAGPVFAEGRVVKRGRSTFFMEASVLDPDGRHLARASSVGVSRKIKR